MKKCNYCGVELDSTMNQCPLCGLAIGEQHLLSNKYNFKQGLGDKTLNELENMTVSQRRKLFWEISGIILVSGIIATVIIDLIVNKNITWSKYNIIASFTVFANISFITFFRSRSILLVLGSLISNALLLVLLDLISSNSGWGIKLGIPILISFYVVVIGVICLLRITHRRGFNILAVIFIAVGIFLVCTEAFISLYFKNTIQLMWSIIVGASILPIAALMVFIHYRLKKGTDLRRFFNI